MLTFRFLGAATLAAALCACSGGSGAIAPATTLPPSASQPSSADTAATQTYPLGGGTQTVTLPNLSACKGRVTLPAVGATPAGASLTLTTSLAAPSGIPLLSNSVRPMTSGHLNVLCYVTFATSNTVTFPTLPGFAVTVASTISTSAPQQFFYALSDPTATNVALSFRTEGPATVTGQTLTFAASPSPLTLFAHKNYIFAFYGIVAATVGAVQHLYVTNPQSNTVSVFDVTNTPTALPPITGGGLNNPNGAAVDANGKLYVANGSNVAKGSVSVFDTAHGNVALPPITGGGLSSPFFVAVDGSGKLYVTNFLVNAVSVFDTAHGNAPLPPITGGGLAYPTGIAVDKSGKLYVANEDYPSSVSVFDTAHGNAVLPAIAGGALNTPLGLAIDAQGKLYVSNLDPPYNVCSCVLVYDTTRSNAALTPITGGRVLTPAGLALDTSGKLYVADITRQVNVFDTAHGNAALSPITITGAGFPYGVAVH